MFQNLVRRISASILPRSDRPWSEDATSNAPTIGRKRRLSIQRVCDEGESASKKAKGEDSVVTPSCDDIPSQVAPEAKEPEEVNEVTEGVNEVGLENEKPETIPLPASPPPDSQDEEDKKAVSLTKSPKSRNSTTAKDVNVSPTSAKSAAEPVAADASANPDSVAPTKAPRKTRKLPTKAAKPSSKAAKNNAAESKETTSGGEFIVFRMDGGGA